MAAARDPDAGPDRRVSTRDDEKALRQPYGPRATVDPARSAGGASGPHPSEYAAAVATPIPATDRDPSGVDAAPFAHLWSTLPELEGAVDPFSFGQRMALYRLLLRSTNPGGVFGPDNAANVFWGYAFQCHWQWRSGRYALAGADPDRIDPAGAWCHGNYLLSVLPYLGAVRAGLAPDLELRPPTSGPVDAYPAGGGAAGPLRLDGPLESVVEAWEAFFARLVAHPAGEDTEPLRFALWEAHGTSLEATEAFRSCSAPSSVNERDFFDGWVRMVDFLGAAAWRTDLAFMLGNALDVLPDRVLRDDDVPGSISDMGPALNANLGSVLGLTHLGRRRFAFNLWLWRRAMRTREARDDVVAMLGAQFQPTPENAPARRRLLRYTLAP